MALAKRLNIFCVSFHVDYFLGGSWTDGFSDARFSARQRSYEHKRFSGYYYTPQMIVNGKVQMLGHNRASAFNAINRSLKLPAEWVFLLKGAPEGKKSEGKRLESDLGETITIRDKSARPAKPTEVPASPSRAGGDVPVALESGG